jgi:pullulanase
MTKTADIQANLTFLEGLEANVVGYTINNSPNSETAKALCIIYNANKASTSVTIPEGDWNVYVKGNKAGVEILETISGGTVTVEPISAIVLVQEDSKATATPSETIGESDEEAVPASTDADKNNNTILYVVIGIVVVIAVAVVFFVNRKKKSK